LYDVPETPLRITGKDKKEFLEKIFTRNIDKIKTGRAVYAFACNHDGGILMDGVLMHPSEDEFIYVQANGDFINWATANIGNLDVKIDDFNSWVLQIQGPTSLDVLSKITDINLEEFTYYSCSKVKILNKDFYVSRSGWTGEKGFELYSDGDNFSGEELWNYLLEAGKEEKLIASDIASMHIRRIEAGILDYGTDFDQRFDPFDLGLQKFIDFDKSDFIGKEALVKKGNSPMRIRGIRCPSEKPVVDDELQSVDGKVIGSVTAGAWSPFLETGIAIVQLNYDLESLSEGKLRTNSGIHDVKICDLPFHDKEKNIPIG
jgi:aminomethyltransferase